jgi:dimeric dUTPase (all-alpha-NTP-PPase superfamily)
MAIHFPTIPATFRNVPRTGTTSFKEWVKVNIENKDIVTDDRHPNMLSHLTLEEINKRWGTAGTTFGFVRNPYERLVSIFHFLGQDAKKRIQKRKNNSAYEDLARMPVEADLKVLINYNRGFDYWIKNSNTDVGSVTLSMFNNKHIQTQMYWYQHCVPNIIIKLENIDTEFVKVQDLLVCHKPFIHINSSIHTHYRDYYTDTTQKIAAKWLEEDLDTFGYVF